MNKITKSWHVFFNLSLLFIICLMPLTGCNKAKSPVTKTGVYFDTVISITLYEKDSSKRIDECFLLAEKYEKMLSKTNPESDISKVNANPLEWVSVAPESMYVIEKGLEYEALSDGKFSVMCGALTELWDIGSRDDESPLPSKEEIESAIALCGAAHLDIDEESNSLRINTKGSSLDVGAVAKGFIADEMKAYLISKGVTSGVIQLGGNVLLIGENPTKDTGLYTIGISKPFADTEKGPASDSVITAVTNKDCSVVTSGNYQRYFKSNGKIYHHIIDLTTGYPADTGLNSATIICEKSVDADCLSTVCFLLGKEKSNHLLKSLNSVSNSAIDIEAIYVTSNNELSY